VSEDFMTLRTTKDPLRHWNVFPWARKHFSNPIGTQAKFTYGEICTTTEEAGKEKLMPSINLFRFNWHQTSMGLPRMDTAQLTLFRIPFNHPDFIFELKVDGFRGFGVHS
jgi:hypothetical protein